MVNRPRKNDKSGESHYILDNENTDSHSDNKTESKTSNLYSKANEPGIPINISSVQCVCSCHKEIEQLKSEILSVKKFFKKEIEDVKAVFSSSNDEKSNSIKSVNDRLVQHLLEENKTKNDIIKILVGNFSVNVNKPQNTDFSLQRPQNDLVNSELQCSLRNQDINKFHQFQKNLLNQIKEILKTIIVRPSFNLRL